MTTLKIDHITIELTKEHLIGLLIGIAILLILIFVYYTIKTSLIYYKKIQYIKTQIPVTQPEETSPIIKRHPTLGNYQTSLHKSINSPQGSIKFDYISEGHRKDHLASISPLKSFKSTYSLKNGSIP